MMSDTRRVKIRSYEVTEGARRAPARAMLRAVGLKDEDFDKPQVGIASSWNEVTPCNLVLGDLAKRAKAGVQAAGGVALEFGTIAVSDGISMGHEGMHASLVSREVIADSVELMMRAERFDAMVTLAGCDKSLPGMMMAAARLDLPAVFVYGGSILPGRYRDQVLDIVSVFEAVGAHAAGTIDDAELAVIERNACPTAGSCAGMYTANTMASVSEALGLAQIGSASAPAVDRRREDVAYAAGVLAMRGLEQGVTPRRILTKPAFLNAIAAVMALGGSTNAVLHLLAIAHEARVELSLEDFNRVAARVPHLADTKPHGKYHMTDLDRIGGIPVVLRELLEAGLLEGDALTVTGRTIGEELEDYDPPRADGAVVHHLDVLSPRLPYYQHVICCYLDLYMVFIENGRIVQRRSWLRLRTLLEFFWGFVNMIALFFQTLFSMSSSGVGNQERRNSWGSVGYRSGSWNSGRPIGRVTDRNTLWSSGMEDCVTGT
jgi:dihydroxy-acid dehydratase